MKTNKLKFIQFDRSQLPSAIDYYSTYFPTLKNKPTWATVHCCFHDDKNPSLRLHLITGGFYCFGCGAKGGDIIDFHQRRFQLTFREAITCLGAWPHVHPNA